ncbi:unnamed protein product [Parnassius mnemosyne]|uniref:Tc1-like transposase DDE domain-containing protein n=1 Tax=Parnassius mnemosyne TaxID=213953 RepID=A0AAV1M3U5_9NEOP
MTKRELYYVVCRSKPTKQYEIDEIVQSHGHEVLRLPPYQCDLNPIEHAWNLVKQKVADKNVSQSEKEIQKLTLEAINSISVEHWKKEVNHVDRLRQQYWDSGRLQELNERELIISVGGETDDSDTEWSDDIDTKTSDFENL